MLPNIEDSPEFTNVTPKALLDWYKTPEAQWFKKELRVGFDGMSDDSIAEVFLYGGIGKGRKVIIYLNKSKQFNIQKDYGSVEVGKVANLLLLESSPLDSIDAWNAIQLVILNGEPIKRDDLAVRH